MNHNKPFISIVIPTRNRPELLKFSLQSLLLQTFTDFEVIVSDNHTGKPCKSVFDQCADQRFRYVTPPSPLLMHDNWEFACNFAQGVYITVLMDKTVLRPSALQIIYETLGNKHADIISWWNDTFVPLNEDISYENGNYFPSRIKPIGPYYYDPRAELERRISCSSSARSDAAGGSYYWGKICFGAYHHDLVRRIHSVLGRLFPPVTPDYTSMIAALAFADSALDVGEPLSITFASKLSNGFNFSIHPEHAFRFLHEIDPTDQIVQKLPIKGLYSSVHNIVAYDYEVMKDKIGKPLQSLELNKKNLVLLAKEDMEYVIWKDHSVRDAQMEIWRRSYNSLSFQQRFSIRLRRPFLNNNVTRLRTKLTTLILSILNMFPTIKSKIKSFFHLQMNISYKTIIDAAKFADEACFHRKAK